jgi:Na+/melibiose symporter-like transporter
MCGTAGAALGTITSGWIVQVLSKNAAAAEVKAYRIIFILYAAVGIIKLVLVLALSPRVELHDQTLEYQAVIELEDEELLSATSSPRDSTEERPQSVSKPASTERRADPNFPKDSIVGRLRALLPQVTRKSLVILVRLILLFSLDSFASGMASPSWLTYFFTTFHDVEPATLGTLFFTTNVLATLSNFAALPLARRLGPLKTMTFTHLPSAIFLALIPIPKAGTPGTLMSMALLSLRACTQSMDQAPRQAFLAAVMKPQERTAILGVINIVKTIAQAGGIGSSGVLAAGKSWRIMLGGAGLMKATYDLLILWTFLGVPDREDEER